MLEDGAAHATARNDLKLKPEIYPICNVALLIFVFTVHTVRLAKIILVRLASWASSDLIQSSAQKN